MTSPPSRGEAADAAPPEAAVPLAPVHDFARKLRQDAVRDHLAAYVAWQRARRAAEARGDALPPPPAAAPVSINLDLTTACNFACDHCIDWETLNSGVAYDHDDLLASLDGMAARGLESVILIGGGEPTVHPRFGDVVRHLKDLDLQVAVVTNGSRLEKVAEVVDRLDERDWIRLSLDSGTDPTFQAMHKPKRPITLEAICEGVGPLKAINARPRIGFSYVITWQGAEREDGTTIVENVHEIVDAARLARRHGFDYIAYKPFLLRTPDGAEVLDAEAVERHEATVAAIRRAVDEARALATDDFDVVESTNLRVLETGTWRAWTRQPRTCHMQAFRQVLSPLGLWNCPAHRGVAKARIADRDVYARGGDEPDEALADVLDRFDASRECREVTCLYHAANWWVERAIEDPRVLEDAAPDDGQDFFL